MQMLTQKQVQPRGSERRKIRQSDCVLALIVYTVTQNVFQSQLGAKKVICLMVSAQQEANGLFLKSDSDRKATPSDNPVHCTILYPQMASAKVLSQRQRVHLR